MQNKIGDITILLMGLTPILLSLFCSQPGDGDTLMPANITPAYLLQASVFSITTSSLYRNIIWFKSIFKRGNHFYSAFVMMRQVGTYIFGNTHMAHGIHTVWCKPYFQYRISRRPVIILCCHAGSCVRGEYNNSLMAVADANFIFGTQHAMAFYAAYRCLFNRKWLFI